MTSHRCISHLHWLSTQQIKSPLQRLALCISSLMLSTASFASEQVAAHAEIVSLPVIKVYAYKDQKTASNLTTISRNQLDQMGANDMAGIVKYLPLVSAPKASSGSGAAWDSAGTSGYNIRGVDGNRIGLDVDGINLADAAPQPSSIKANSYGVGRNFIDPEMFAEVDIRSGTTDVSKDGIGGRVSFKTKSPELYLKDHKNAYAAYKTGYSSADDAWLNSVTAAVGNETLQTLLAYARRDGHEMKSESIRKVNPADWHSDAVLSKLLWNITAQQQLGFTFDYYQRNTDSFIDAETLGKSYPKGGMQHEKAQRSRYALDYRLNAENLLFDQLKTQLYYQETTNKNLLNAFYLYYPRKIQNDFENEVWGLNADAIKVQGIHDIQYGLSMSQAKDDRPWISTNTDTDTSKQANLMVASDTQKYALYAQDSLHFTLADRDLTVSPGLRAEYQKFDPKNTNKILNSNAKREQVQSATNHYLAPSLVVSYQLSPDYLSYVQYHRGARIPSASEMAGSFDSGHGYSILGNSKLKKESSDAFELGFKTTPITGLRLDLLGFYTRYSDFIDYQKLSKPVNGDFMMTYQLQNLSQANIWGGELSAYLDLAAFVNDADGFSLALVAGKARGTSKDHHGLRGGVNSVQPEKASLSFAYDAPEHVYGVSVIGTAVGRRLATRDASIDSSTEKYQPVAGYAIADLSAYWKLNKYAKLNLGLNNIFDKKYRDYATVGTLTSENLIDRATLPGRNLVASVEFKY